MLRRAVRLLALCVPASLVLVLLSVVPRFGVLRGATAQSQDASRRTICRCRGKMDHRLRRHRHNRGRHDGLRVSDRRRRSAGRHLFPAGAGSDRSGDGVRQRRQAACARLAAQFRFRANVRGRRDVLHSDGDAAGPSGRVLQRSRVLEVNGRADAVGAARHRVREPADLGRDLRSHRRACDDHDRLGVAGRVDGGVSVDAK